MTASRDRLYELLPAIHRIRDVERGEPLRALLQVIAEQLDIVESDIAALYDNWFIETAAEWAVPYLGDLVGYRPVLAAGTPGDVTTASGQALNRVLVPRREVANTIAYRRRKGTVALLEQLANDVAGWPARAVELRRLLGWTQALNHQRRARGRTADLREMAALDRLGGPFDEMAHTAEIRRINARPPRGYYNLPSVGLFLWRLRSYSVTQTHAYCLEERGPHCFTFSFLSNQLPLFAAQPERGAVLTELNVPSPISRRLFERHPEAFYGEGKSLAIWVADKLVPVEKVVVADLTDWYYRPPRHHVAIDPETGRFAFPPSQLPRRVRVSYHYGFSADIGGGEYPRTLAQSPTVAVQVVTGPDELKAALEPWRKADDNALYDDQPADAVIEIGDSSVYSLPIAISLKAGHSLQIRARSGARPTIRLLDWQADSPDSLFVNMASESRFTLDGLLITGRAVHIRGDKMTPVRGEVCPAVVTIRHCTLVPGWGLNDTCEPRRPDQPSLELFNVRARLVIAQSIVGSIQVHADAVKTDPIPVQISDSIVDATSHDREALGAPGLPVAHVRLTLLRSTVFGSVQAHAVDLAENSIVTGCLTVARRQLGCVRFCSVDPMCETPRRFHCQPDLAQLAAEEALAMPDGPAPTADAIAAARRVAAERVRPRFTDTRYGTPGYARLAETCADEITRGAEDESEMGAFHDLFQPQRVVNLRARLEEYAPTGTDTGIIFVNE